MKNLRPHRHMIIGLALSALGSFAQAQTYTVLHNFNWHIEGCCPNAPTMIAEGRDGNLYSTLQTQLYFDGSVFSSTPSGTLSTLYNFSGADGNHPQSGLSPGIDGNYYGTTTSGGAFGAGTVFKVSGGVVTTLYSFTNGTDGAYPWAPPIQALDLSIYGVTYNGTTQGVIYRITPSGVFSVIAKAPSETQAPLILGSDGYLYGTTPYGGTYNRGTVFQLTTSGTVNIIHSFNPSTEGSIPGAPVMQASDGNFYGTTGWGGTYGEGIVFQLSPGGAYQVLHNFNLTPDGGYPSAGVVMGSDGYLYGAAASGGTNGFGTLYKVSTTGTNFAVLHNFDTSSGSHPYSTPLLHTNGKIYGTTVTGGPQYSGYGVLYSLDAGLKPFASIVGSQSGKMGDLVALLGQGFLSATGVKFGIALASWTKVLSDNYMIVTVPMGAASGKITVLEPGGNLLTSQSYNVIGSCRLFCRP